MPATPLQNAQARLRETLATRPSQNADSRFFTAMVLALAAFNSPSITNLAIVDAANGNDATGTLGTFAPYQTLSAALAAAVPNTYIWLVPGTYNSGAASTVIPPLEGLSILGLGNNPTDTLITSTNGTGTLVLAAGATINALTLESLQVQNTGAGKALFIGEPTVTRFDDVNAGLVLRNLRLDKVQLDNLGKVQIDNCTITVSLDERGLGLVDHLNSRIEGYICHYLDVTSTTQPTVMGRVGNYFTSCRCNTSFVLSGCPSVDLDEGTILTCLLDATGLSSFNVAGLTGLDPYLRCSCLIGATGVGTSNPVVDNTFLGLSINTGPVAWQTAGAGGAAGFDLSGCRVYGNTTIVFGVDLAAVVLDRKAYQFNAVGAQFLSDLNVSQTPAIGGAQRYWVTARNSQLGIMGQVGVEGTTPTVTANKVDLDIRGSSRENVVLAVAGAGTIDRDRIVVQGAAVAALATTFTFGGGAPFAAEPPFPAGATYTVTATRTDGPQTVAPDVPTVTAQSATGFTMGAQTNPTTVDFIIERGPN